MDEHDYTPEGASLSVEEEAVARLLAEAGSRPPIPPEDLAAISAAARSAWQMEVRRRAAARRRRASWTVVSVAAAALLALAVGFAWWSGALSRGPAWIEAANGPLQLTWENGAWRKVSRGTAVLPGVATLRLEGGTRARFTAASTLELAAGAVYFDSGPANASHLVVETAYGTARDVGTRFEVRLAEAMVVRVRDGRVSVASHGLSQVAAAGQQLVLHEDGRVERREIAPYGPGWEWVLAAAGPFAVEGRTVPELLDWVTRETGWQVRYADEELAAKAREIVLHGRMGTLRPDQAPFVLLPGAGLEGKLHGDTLEIRRLR
jgi:ferric-dicitrate binding protein FerR (iron transport regulator)